MTIMAYAANSTETSGTDLNAWLAKLQEGKKSLAQMQQEMLKSSVESVSNKVETDATAKTDEDADEEETTNSIQDPSTVTKEQLKSPIDIKL